MNKGIFKSKVVSNYLYNLSYQILVTIVPIITIPYLTRVLGAHSLGIARYVESVGSIFVTFGLLGLAWYSNRAIAYARKNPEEISRCFWEIFFMRIFLFLVTIAVYAVVTFRSGDALLYKIFVISIAGSFLDTSWFFIGLEEMKPVTIRNYIVKIISTAAIFLFVRKPEDVAVYIWIVSLTMIGNALIMVPWLRRYLQPVERNSVRIWKHFPPAIALFLPQAATMIYVQCDKLMIKHMIGNPNLIAFYSENEKIAKMPIILASALSTVLMPRIALEFSKGKQGNVKSYIQKSFFFTYLVLFPCCVGILMVAKRFVPFFLGAEFADTYKLLMLFCPIMIFVGFSNVTGIQYLVALDRTRELTISYVTAAIVNVGINALLIPKIDVYGACIGTLVAEALVFGIQYYYMKKDLGEVFEANKLIKTAILALIMGLIVFALGYLKFGNILTMAIQIVAGIVIYVAGALALGLVRRRGGQTEA